MPPSFSRWAVAAAVAVVGLGFASPGRTEELRAEIAAAVPAPRDEAAFLPRAWSATLQRRVGSLMAWLGDQDAAARHLQRAIDFGHGDPALRLALGDATYQTGRLDAAANHWERALQHADAPPELRASALGRLGSRALALGKAERAVELLESATSLEPEDATLLGLLRRARYAADPEVEPQPREFTPLLPRIAGEDRGIAAAASGGLIGGLEHLPRSLREPLRDLMLNGAHSAWMNLAIALIVSLFVLVPLLRVARGRGGLVVLLHYPSELRGTFSVRLSRSDESLRRNRKSATHDRLASTRTCHAGVSRETHFRRVAVGRWFVSVEGVLQSGDSDAVLAERFEVREVQLSRSHTQRLELDLRPSECPIDVSVLWDGRPARDAGVAVLGRPETLRFARGGQARLRLPPGQHTIVVGSGDRVAQCSAQVGSYAPEVIAIDLAGTAEVVFKGCPPAVQPYLQGDLAEAANALMREGLEQAAAQLLAHLALERGDERGAAEHYERADQWLEAGALCAGCGDWARAAELFERAGDLARAAEAFERADDWMRAGAAHERARDFTSAIRCYREVGATAEWVRALERCGLTFEAAERALAAGDRRTAIRLFQHVLPEDPRHTDACRQLAIALELEGHADLAACKLEELVAATQASAPERSHLADLLEAQGEVERALAVLEALRIDEPTFPNLAGRVESLRKRQSEAQVIARPPTLSGSAQASAHAATSGVTTIPRGDRYEILEEIGRGGMGVVYRAHDRRLDREVALKRMPHNLREHPRAVDFFLREAQAAARLNHPNIVTIHDVDQQDGLYFITMELLKGSPLNRLLSAHDRLGARDVAKLGLQVATGLRFAHEQGIVHRDIKTANLFLTMDRTVKIMDFGLAKMLAEVRGASTMIGGTPFYMSPEQAVGGSVDHRADFYALGITLFELATGRVPFSEGDVAYHHRHTPAPDPRDLRMDIPRGLAALIGHCLRKDPAARPQSAAELVEQFERVLREP